MRRVVVPISILALAVAGLITLGPSPSSAIQQGSPVPTRHGFVGTWRVVGPVVGQPPVAFLTSLFADGNALTANPPSAPGQAGAVELRSPGLGSWMSTGEETADLTFVSLLGDAQGNALGTRTIRGSLTLDAGRDAWSGTYTVTVADPSGKVIRSARGTVRATRLAVEPAAPTGTPAVAAS